MQTKSIEATTRHLFTTRHLIEFAGNGLLILAFFVLICALMMGGVDKWEARLALFIIGVFLTVSGGFICFQKKEEKKK